MRYTEESYKDVLAEADFQSSKVGTHVRNLENNRHWVSEDYFQAGIRTHYMGTITTLASMVAFEASMPAFYAGRRLGIW